MEAEVTEKVLINSAELKLPVRISSGYLNLTP